jgi:hypothetical protein
MVFVLWAICSAANMKILKRVAVVVFKELLWYRTLRRPQRKERFIRARM